MSPDRENSIIEVSMAGMEISSAPSIMITRGLGSCIGIVLYDSQKKIGALAHPMLPDISKSRVRSNPAKFVDAVIDITINKLRNRNCRINLLEAKIFGGAHMFSTIPHNSPFNIGLKNVSKAKEILNSLNIKVVAEDTGGNYGRTIEFDLSTGNVKVKTLFHGEKVL